MSETATVPQQAKEEAPVATNDSVLDRTVFVSNVAAETQGSELIKFFSIFGAVESFSPERYVLVFAYCFHIIVFCFLPCLFVYFFFLLNFILFSFHFSTDASQQTKTFKVTFEKPESVVTALALDGKPFGMKTLHIVKAADFEKKKEPQALLSLPIVEEVGKKTEVVNQSYLVLNFLSLNIFCCYF